MRRSTPAIAFVAALASLVVWLLACLVGCEPTPDQICGHVVDLASARADKKGAVLGEGSRNGVRNKCLAQLRDLAKSNAKEGRCLGKCVLQAQLYDDVDTCTSLCAVADDNSASPSKTSAKSSGSAKKTEDEDAGGRATKKKK